MKLAITILCLGWGACVAGPPESSTHQASTGLCRTAELPWGSGAGQAGLVEAAPERLARGPAAVAVAPDGAALVLDAENGRVLAVSPQGEVSERITGLVVDSEDLAVGADGSVAVYSPLRSRIWLFDGDGAAAGTIDVDRSLRGVTGLALGASQQLTLRTAFQERFLIGSPAAPTDLPTRLRSKQEGAFARADGRGLAVRAGQGAAHLVVTEKNLDSATRTRVAGVLPLPGTIDAAQLIGAVGDRACLRTEQVAHVGEALSVSRRALCINAKTGAVLHDRVLPKVGLYSPRQELALGGESLRLVSLDARASGLAVTSCEVLR